MEKKPLLLGQRQYTVSARGVVLSLGATGKWDLNFDPVACRLPHLDTNFHLVEWEMAIQIVSLYVLTDLSMAY